MKLGRRTRLFLAAILGAAVASSWVAAAGSDLPPGEPFSTDPSVLVPIEDISSVAIVGIRGQLSISTRETREVQVISRASGTDGAERPVGIWRDGDRLVIAPAPGDGGGPRVLGVEVPARFAIAIDAVDSEVVVLAEGGTVDLRIDNVRATVQAPGAAVVVEALAGSLILRDSKDATLRLRATATTIGGMSGSVVVRATGGTVTVAAGAGSTEVESVETKLTFDGLSGPLRVDAQKGEAKLSGNVGGAELRLAGTPLQLKNGKGNLVVTSDTSVLFEAMAASMHFDMEGGSVRGKGNEGILELRGRDTELHVESIAGGMRVQGQRLSVKIADVGGELQLEAASSEVSVDRAGSVVLRIDGGSVAVSQATGAVQAVVTGADARILDVSGSVRLELEGGNGEVSWASLTADKDSHLTGNNANLTVRFPAAGACRVEAQSRDGRIVSTLPTVGVLEGEREAQGPINNGYRPIVHINATGDIQLLQSGESAP